MTALDKIKALFKWCGKGMGFLVPTSEAKGAEKKAAEPPETKVAEVLEKKGDESSSK